MWRRYFKLKLVPGVVITQKFGRIDFRMDNLPVDMLKELYEDDFPYLDLTEYGRHMFYGVGLPKEPETPSITATRKARTRKVL